MLAADYNSILALVPDPVNDHYSLTTQVIKENTWTPEIVEERQKTLLGVFEKKWDLSVKTEDPLGNTFRLAQRGCMAEAVKEDDGGLTVLKDSTMTMDTTDSLQQTYRDLRQKLIDDGIVVDGVFVKPYKFNSPSAAACVLSGRSANGKTEWTTADGVKLRDVK